MEITVQAPPRFPVGTALDVYPDPGGDIPPSGPIVSSAVVGANSFVTLTNLAPGLPYTVGRFIGGKWLGMLVEIGPLARPGSGQITAAAGPWTSAQVAAAISDGQTLFELDANGNVAAEWVKVA